MTNEPAPTPLQESFTATLAITVFLKRLLSDSVQYTSRHCSDCMRSRMRGLLAEKLIQRFAAKYRLPHMTRYFLLYRFETARLLWSMHEKGFPDLTIIPPEFGIKERSTDPQFDARHWKELSGSLLGHEYDWLHKNSERMRVELMDAYGRAGASTMACEELVKSAFENRER